MIASNPTRHRTAGPRFSAPKVYALVLLAGLSLYWATAQRGAAWQDSGVHQMRVLDAEYENEWGLALAHPLYIAMCQPLRILGEANVPTAMHLLSGVGMAITLANVYLLGRWLTRRNAPAVLAAAALGVCHTGWWLATIAETYCWVTAGLTGELLLLTWLIARPRWWKLLLLALLNGLGFSLHNLALLALPVYVVAGVLLVVQHRMSWLSLAGAAAVWLMGAGPQLGIIIHHGLQAGDWSATIRSALFGRNWQASVMSSSLPAVGKAGMYTVMNWPFLSLVPVVVGWWVMAKYAGRAVGSALGAIAAVHLIFSARYTVPDQFMFLLPAYTLFAVGAAVGIDRLCQLRLRRRRVWMCLVVASLILTPVLYGVAPSVLDWTGRSIRPHRRWPYRDENRYWIHSWKFNERSADTFARDALAVAAPDGVIVLSTTAASPPMVLQRSARLHQSVHIEAREQITLPDFRHDPAGYRAALAGRSLYVIVGTPDFMPEAMAPYVKRRRMMPLYRLDFVDAMPASQPTDEGEGAAAGPEEP